jgi:hypothetical protein
MIEQRKELAEAIANKAQILGTRFYDQYAGSLERNQVVALAEAKIPTLPRHRNVFALWIPMTREAYDDLAVRHLAQERAEKMLIPQIATVLLNNRNIIGPKGKLPA